MNLTLFDFICYEYCKIRENDMPMFWLISFYTLNKSLEHLFIYFYLTYF